MLPGAIKDVNNYDVKLSIVTNPVVFEYSNGPVGNYFEGQFKLTPKSGTNIAPVNLNFRVNNFNDSYYESSGSGLQWDVNAIKKALDDNKPLNGTNNLPNVTIKVTQSNNSASVTIDLFKSKR